MTFIVTEARKQRLAAAGFGADALDIVARARAFDAAQAGGPAQLNADARAVGADIRAVWGLLAKLPPRTKRSAAERSAGEALVQIATEMCRTFAHAYRDAIYSALTYDYARHVRVEDLVYQAAERWPGLVPSRAEIAREMERVQADKDGLEILQGCLISEWLAAPKIGNHLITSMLRPTPTAVEAFDEFKRNGVVDLGMARVEAHGETGYVYVKHPKYLNAEDYETLGPQEAAVDLVLLHPDLKMGVMRGDFVEHPRYAGRRVFNAGLNLTKVYYGKLPYLFYIVRDLGFVNKLYRGHALAELDPEQPEQTLEKPWMAVVESFAIGGGCQLLLVMDYVVAETGSYFNLPARKEGIIPGCANLRLPRYVGERQARAGIMFDKRFEADSPEARMLVNEVVPREAMEEAIGRIVATAVGSGMVSAGANRKAMRVQTEPLDVFRRYMAVYAYEQALCHLSDQLIANLERHWNARQRRLAG
ncbi:MAG: enoyl-CoA hydratase/isomerase family protein [Sulfurifustis sp.]